MEQAQAYSLKYLGDALPNMLPNNFLPSAVEEPSLFKGDLIHQEQMMDFLRNRRFHHTLIVSSKILIKSHPLF
ncbi:methyltransferase regulatory domain-containing protein [Candidatus Parabeggiatoa sp. HSG14]|uniref:methyltransferase regulatory domain-containing protein n=1 Tax=Candidatus Parabeggiatoa sp. HSG14 TaxID=3055593 RepID=UPI0025A7CB87|nr:methyltransferase regulatory domain-containing protein [Thiotrichales bacterium HSG14]